MADIPASRVLYVEHADQVAVRSGDADQALMFLLRGGTLTVALTGAGQTSLCVFGDAAFDLILLAAATLDGTA